MAISAFLTALGGTFYAQYFSFIDPTIAFGPAVSVEILLRPIVGGPGTLIGPRAGIARPHATVRADPLAHPRPSRRRRHGVRGRPGGRDHVPARWAGRRLATGSPPRDSVMALLELRGLTKHFGGLVAVSGVTFDVEAGELVGLIGPNGAGKTTLFHLITGFHRPTAGGVRFDGRRRHRASSPRRVPARDRADLPDRPAVSGAVRPRQRGDRSVQPDTGSRGRARGGARRPGRGRAGVSGRPGGAHAHAVGPPPPRGGARPGDETTGAPAGRGDVRARRRPRCRP